MSLANLVCGLDLDEIKNPSLILRQLTTNLGKNADKTDKTNGGELLELASPLSIEAADYGPRLLPRLIEPKGPVGSHNVDDLDWGPFRRAFKCTCPRLSVDQQRRRYCNQVYGQANSSSSSSHRTSDMEGQQQQQQQHQDQTMAWRRRRKEESGTSVGGGTQFGPISSPSIESQLKEFGRLDRNSAAKRMARRFRLYGRDYISNCPGQSNPCQENLAAHGVRGTFPLTDVASLSLYKIEEFLLEANNNLADTLKAESRHSSLVLKNILGAFLSQTPMVGGQHSEDNGLGGSLATQPVPVVMIHAPLSNASISMGLSRSRIGSKRFRWSSRLWGWSDSGIDLKCDRPMVAQHSGGSDLELDLDLEVGERRACMGQVRRKAPTSIALEELVEFRADSRVQAIVRQSVELFAKLLDENPLFRLIKNGNNLFNSQELKLYACIECQRLRSSLRFKWITQCLMVACSHPETETATTAATTTTTLPKKLLARPSRSKPSRCKEQAQECAQEHWLPPIELHKLEDLAQLKYFDLLANLMGALLRQHFLVPALDRWYHLLEAHQLAQSPGSTVLATQLESANGGKLSGLTTNKPKLGIQVELIKFAAAANNKQELAGSSNLLSSGLAPCNPLGSSRPEEELKETLNFVVDELASVCGRLPRIESQLESQAALFVDTQSTREKRDKFILTLEADDNLLLETKCRIGHLIDRSNSPLAGERNQTERSFLEELRRDPNPDGEAGQSFNEQLDTALPMADGARRNSKVRMGRGGGGEGEGARGGGGGGRRTTWVDSDYLLIVELVNNFRRGGTNSTLHQLWSGSERLVCFDARAAGKLSAHESSAGSSADDGADADDRLQRLRACYQQIGLLDSLEQQLTCRLGRHYDHGFVLLDYAPLRDSLLKCIQKERLLLIRLHLDELLRLMDRLQLQFEEIELGVDLEAGIEDYLANRRQMKQSQHQQVLMDHIDEDMYVDHLDAAAAAATVGQNSNLQQSSGAEAEVVAAWSEANKLPQIEQREILPLDEMSNPDDSREAEEFVEAISQGHTNEGAHKLFALDPTSDNTTSNQYHDDEMMATGRQVIPIIECQLLVARYEFMSELLANELRSLASDIRVAFEGLVFLSEFVGHDQLDPTHWQLITGLAIRSSEFRPMLSLALGRLKMARAKLCHSNELRSRVLSRLVLEFHQLMGELAARFLASDDAQPEATTMADRMGGQVRRGDTHMTGEKPHGRRIVQLDTIQETAAWARELQLRFLFLWRQNSLLAQEGHLLSRAKLTAAKQEGGVDLLLDTTCGDTGSQNKLGQQEEEEEEELWRRLREPASEARASVLERWRPLVGVVTNLWRLIEEYETQQVKWLNSDTKRIDFLKMDSTFKLFTQRLSQLREQAQRGSSVAQSDHEQPSHDLTSSLEHNLDELERRFDQFARRRLPLFRFLTNKYLTDGHWRRVTELLLGSISGERSGTNPRQERSPMFAGLMLAQQHQQQPQACTTLAQFLELNAEWHVEELEIINREAIIEQELTNFLLSEVSLVNSNNNNKYLTSERRAQLKALDMSGAWFVGWTNKQLVMAASRFIEAKLEERKDNNSSFVIENFGSHEDLAAKLVACHSMVRRHLKLRYEIGLDSPMDLGRLIDAEKSQKSRQSGRLITLRSCKRLASAELVSPSLFVEFLRLFTAGWLGGRTKLAGALGQLELDLATMDRHLDDIQILVDQTNELRANELRSASSEGESTLVGLERESVRLEMEREILATMESLALERQREALGKRDKCILQITERAIPAIRAATRALDCLDARSLKTLRYVRPNPPEAVRLVLEAVCLLRSCVSTSAGGGQQALSRPMEPERRFDALSGRIREDYWQPACRMLNGTHSSRFLADLRRIDKRRMPAHVMRLIRRRYLSSRNFRPELIGRVSPECGLLCRWLIAVDVFDRVITVVRPNYSSYLESERQLAGLLAEVNNRRCQIESIGLELQRMEEALEGRIGLKMSLADSLDQCCEQMKKIELTRTELICRRQACAGQIERIRRQQSRLANRCLMRAAETVYLDAIRPDERKPMVGLLRTAMSEANSTSRAGFT